MPSKQGLLQQTHDKWYGELMKGEYHAEMAMGRAYKSIWQEMEPRWRAVHEALSAELDPLDPNLSWKVFQDQRYRSAHAYMVANTLKYSPALANEIAAMQELGALAGRDATLELIRASYGNMAVEQLRLRQLPTQDITHMVGNLRDGSPLRDLTNALGKDAGKQVGQKLVAGIAMGDNPLAVARSMKQAFGGNLARAQMVARTEMHRAHRMSTLDHFQANKHAVKQWRWQATLDDRCCMACILQHGRLYSLSTMMETHPSCRCRMSPVPPNSQFDAVRGETWFQSLSPDDQIRFMGPEYWEAWQAGAFKLRELVNRTHHPKWGGGMSVTPLRQLLAPKAPKVPKVPKPKAPPKPKPPKPAKEVIAESQEYLKFGPRDWRQLDAKVREYVSKVSDTVMHKYSSGVSDYKGAGYVTINSILRKKPLPSWEDNPYSKERGLRKIKEIDAAFKEANVRLVENTVVYRGTAVRDLAAAAARGENVVGLEYSDLGYMSTSLGARTAEDFARKAVRKRGIENTAMLEIRLPRNTPVLPLEKWTDMGEAELLLQRGRKFRVVEQGTYVPNHGLGQSVVKLVLEPID